jgi:hypothetical protein
MEIYFECKTEGFPFKNISVVSNTASGKQSSPKTKLAFFLPFGGWQFLDEQP